MTSTRKRALITGVTGQDGSYLAEFLLDKDYEVHGLIRRASTFNTGRIDHMYADQHDASAGKQQIKLHYADLSDGTSLRKVLHLVVPDEIYHLGAQSHVRVSFDIPEYTADIVGTGSLRLLEAVLELTRETGRDVRLYQAGSSEMFGSSPPLQSEETPFRPRSPYAVAKVAAYHFATNYRDAYGLFICNGILFNHESERRGETFVSRKITRAIGRISCGVQNHLYLGNLQARRDWGHASDYVRAMWLMLHADKPDDYVIATGESYSVQEFVERAFGCAGLNWRDHVKFDEKYLRPTEVDSLRGDAAKARAALGWEPSISFDGLVKRMVDHDIDLARRERSRARA